MFFSFCFCPSALTVGTQYFQAFSDLHNMTNFKKKVRNIASLIDINNLLICYCIKHSNEIDRLNKVVRISMPGVVSLAIKSYFANKTCLYNQWKGLSINQHT